MFNFLKRTGFALFITLVGCAQGELDKFDQGLKSLNQVLGAPSSSGNYGTPPSGSLAVRGDASKTISTELVIPADRATEEAMNAALPTVKKVIALHQCMKNGESLRLLNAYAVTGMDMQRIDIFFSQSTPNERTRYHDKSQCVDVKALDQWTLLALNTLRVRAVYFAVDSGETFNLRYHFKKSNDGSWKISNISE